MGIRDVLAPLYAKMGESGIDAYLITDNDPHFSPDPVEYWKVLEHLVGFRGDNGCLLLFRDNGIFFTDSRFSIEMEEKLRDSGVRLSVCGGKSEEAAFSHLLKLPVANEFSVGFDDRTVHVRSVIALGQKPNIKIKPVDLVGKVWDERPPLLLYKVSDIENLVFPGTYNKIFVPRESKLSILSAMLGKLGDTFAFLFTDLSDIAWLLNIRAFDNAPSVLAPAFLILLKDKGYLFVQGKVDNRLKYDLSEIAGCGIRGISVLDYGDFFTKAHFLLPRGTHIIETSDDVFTANMASVLPAMDYPHFPLSREKIESLKSIHTVEEVECAKIAFREDAVAFVRLLREVSVKKPADEFEFSERLLNERKKSKYFICESFPTIAAFGENAAMCHYAPERKTAKAIGRGVMVVDYGSQYDFGTTDSTRTLVFGRATGAEKRAYTAVLKSHVYLQRISFRTGIEGIKLDAIVRGMLYDHDIEVPHGIGHGVSLLGPVHAETPRLSSAFSFQSGFSVMPGMFFTIEPGVYRKGELGVRIENTVVAVRDEGKPGYMRFEPLTLLPYDRRLIDKSMLSEKDISFIDGYHAKVLSELSPHLAEREAAFLSSLCGKL